MAGEPKGQCGLGVAMARLAIKMHPVAAAWLAAMAMMMMM